jgi:DNA-binding NtrC family response regulator
MRKLQSYSWPGNIRELRNVLERAVLLSEDRILTRDDFHFDVNTPCVTLRNGSVRTLEDVKRQYIEEVLLIEDGNVGRAAERLGVPRSSLYHTLKQYRMGELPVHKVPPDVDVLAAAPCGTNK